MKNLKLEKINDIMFIDIETVPQWENLDDAPENVKKEWIYKFKFNDDAQKLEDYNKYFSDLWSQKAGLYPEFSKIICISAGYMAGNTFVVKSYFDENEKDLLINFKDDLNSFYNYNKNLKLCAHYGKGFDYPFIARRLLINRINLPVLLDGYGIKPWESVNLDTHEMWKIGSLSSSSTLGAIAMAFGLPSPKDDIEGADVAKTYYNGELKRIVKYCEKDTLTCLNIFLCMRGENAINLENVKITNK